MVTSKFIIYPIRYLSPFLFAGGDSKKRFDEGLRAYLGGNVYVHALGRARTGVYLLCKLAAQGGRRRVLMSPYTIPDLANMVRLAGCTPVFVDFQPNSTNFDLDQLKASLGSDTACVLLTHYHVNQEATKAIVKLCHDHGAYCFDDCAISFGGSIEGAPFGTVTDASVFSFSFFKALNYFWGGCVATHRKDISDQLEEMMKDFAPLKRTQYKSQMRKCAMLDTMTRNPVFSTAVFPRLQHKARKTSAPPELPFTRLENKEMNPTLLSRPAPAMYHELARKLPDVNKQLAHRRQIAAIYDQVFGDVVISPEASQGVRAESTYSVYPIRVPAEKRAETRAAMILAGFDVGASLYPSVNSIERFDFCEGSAPQALALSQSMIFLPTHPRVTPDYAAKLAAGIRPLVDAAWRG